MLETPLALLIVIFSAFVVLYYVPYVHITKKYCMLYMRAYGASISDVIDDVT